MARSASSVVSNAGASIGSGPSARQGPLHVEVLNGHDPIRTDLEGAGHGKLMLHVAGHAPEVVQARCDDGHGLTGRHSLGNTGGPGDRLVVRADVAVAHEHTEVARAERRLD